MYEVFLSALFELYREVATNSFCSIALLAQYSYECFYPETCEVFKAYPPPRGTHLFFGVRIIAVGPLVIILMVHLVLPCLSSNSTSEVTVPHHLGGSATGVGGVRRSEYLGGFSLAHSEEVAPIELGAAHACDGVAACRVRVRYMCG